MTLCLLLLVSSFAFAKDHGQTGSFATGCGSCHGSSASADTTSSFSASATTVAPGEVVDIDFTVASADASRTHAGLNVGSSAGGTFAAGSNNQLKLSQITHSSPTAMTAGTVSYDFTWTAPSAEGTYTIEGAGNAVNNNGSVAGDGWSLATDLTITVDDGCDDFDGDGYENCGGDCDDDDASVSPIATETCDDLDNDCDDTIDEADASDVATWYPDADGDGYGVDDGAVTACDAPAGYQNVSGDCDDANTSFNPGATEACDDPTDYNCDGTTGYADADADGWAACMDCNDADSSAHPDATEICDLADDDCDGLVDNDALDAARWYSDSDGDGYGDADVHVTDCDDSDGYVDNSGDCDDAAESVNPGEDEIWYDGVDQDCDERDDDQDGDGASVADDCDDTDDSVRIACDTGASGGDDGGGGTGGATKPDTTDDASCGGCASGGAVPGSVFGLAMGVLALLLRWRAETPLGPRRRS